MYVYVRLHSVRAVTCQRFDNERECVPKLITVSSWISINSDITHGQYKILNVYACSFCCVFNNDVSFSDQEYSADGRTTGAGGG